MKSDASHESPSVTGNPERDENKNKVTDVSSNSSSIFSSSFGRNHEVILGGDYNLACCTKPENRLE